MQVGLELEPSKVVPVVLVANGTLVYPVSTTTTMPPNGTMYLNITALGCDPRTCSIQSSTACVAKRGCAAVHSGCRLWQ